MKIICMLIALCPVALYSQLDTLVTNDDRQLIGLFKGSVVDNVNFETQDGNNNVLNYMEIKRLALKEGQVYDRFVFDKGKLYMSCIMRTVS